MKVPANIVHINQESPTVRSFLLDTGSDGLKFSPGQWIDCYVEVDGLWQVAGYSLMSSPSNPSQVEIAVKLLGTNPVTQFLHNEVRIGDTLWIEGGQGDFHYDPRLTKNILLIGGGIGITPLMSIIRYASAVHEEIRMGLVYSAKSVSELLFKNELDELSRKTDKFRALYTVSQDVDPNWLGRTGRITDTMILDAITLSNPTCYISGPLPLVTHARMLLLQMGIQPDHIKYEEWW